jgi:hypothetical protein
MFFFQKKDLTLSGILTAYREITHWDRSSMYFFIFFYFSPHKHTQWHFQLFY